MLKDFAQILVLNKSHPEFYIIRTGKYHDIISNEIVSASLFFLTYSENGLKFLTLSILIY
jgi:hypothetical protein